MSLSVDVLWCFSSSLFIKVMSLLEWWTLDMKHKSKGYVSLAFSLPHRHQSAQPFTSHLSACFFDPYQSEWFTYSELPHTHPFCLSVCPSFFVPQVSTPSASSPPPSLPTQVKWWQETRRLTSCPPAGQTTRLWAASLRCSTSQSAEPARETHTWWCLPANPSPPRTQRSAFIQPSTQW